MKRFDRALFAVFLLVLLADVARAHASVPASGDPAGNLILTAAAQLSSNSNGAVLAIRRADGSLAPIARLRNNTLPPLAWSRILAARSSSQDFSNSSHLVLLAASSLSQEACAAALLPPESFSGSPSLAIYAHTLSAAP